MKRVLLLGATTASSSHEFGSGGGPILRTLGQRRRHSQSHHTTPHQLQELQLQQPQVKRLRHTYHGLGLAPDSCVPISLELITDCWPPRRTPMGNRFILGDRGIAKNSSGRRDWEDFRKNRPYNNYNVCIPRAVCW